MDTTKIFCVFMYLVCIQHAAHMYGAQVKQQPSSPPPLEAEEPPAAQSAPLDVSEDSLAENELHRLFQENIQLKETIRKLQQMKPNHTALVKKQENTMKHQEQHLRGEQKRLKECKADIALLENKIQGLESTIEEQGKEILSYMEDNEQLKKQLELLTQQLKQWNDWHQFYVRSNVPK